MTHQEFIRWAKSSEDNISIKRVYIDVAGDVVAGVMLSQIMYWHLPSSKGKSRLRIKRDGRMWLAKRRKDWWSECRITEKQVDRCLDKLIEKGIIVTDIFKFSGNPTIHLSVNWENFLSLLNDAIEKLEKNEKGNSKLPKGEKPNADIGNNLLTQKSQTTTKNTTKLNTETTPTDMIVVNESDEYNEHTVKVPLPPDTIRQIINKFTPSAPWHFYHAAHILNWKIEARGFQPKDYDSVIVGMLRQGIGHPSNCPSPLEEQARRMRAEAEKLGRELREHQIEESWHAIEKQFDSLSDEKQTLFLEKAGGKYPLVKSPRGLKDLAMKIYTEEPTGVMSE